MEKVGQFLHGQLIFRPPLPTGDLRGQTLIVTGANTGLGLHAAQHFVRLGAAKVILACRSAEKGAAARQQILTATKRSHEPECVEVWPLDLGSYNSILAFGDRVQGLERLDVVLENAGISTTEFRLAEDNESTVMVNVVGPALLALLVLPKLRETAARFGVKGHLTVVGSAVHYWTKFKERKAIEEGKKGVLEVVNDKSMANMGDRYFLSKLLVLMVWREMVDRMDEGSDVVVNCVEPGLCQSELFREDPAMQSFVARVVFKIVARTTDQGARVVVNAALSGEKTHGGYLASCKVVEPSVYIRSQEGRKMQKALWKELMAKLEKVRPGIEDNLRSKK